MTRMYRGTVTDLQPMAPNGMYALVFDDGRSALIESGLGTPQLARDVEARLGFDSICRTVIGMDLLYRVNELGVMMDFLDAELWGGVENPRY